MLLPTCTVFSIKEVLSYFHLCSKKGPYSAPFQTALFKDSVEIARTLLNAGANTDAKEDQQGLTPLVQGTATDRTALQHTQEEGHCEIIELLVEADAR